LTDSSKIKRTLHSIAPTPGADTRRRHPAPTPGAAVKARARPAAVVRAAEAMGVAMGVATAAATAEAKVK